jgi:hypothetical protein
MLAHDQILLPKISMGRLAAARPREEINVLA